MRTGSTVVAGISLAWQRSGPDESVPVIALHGLSSTKDTWRSFGALLNDRAREVIALDLRVHGQSSRPGACSCADLRDDVLGFIDATGLDRVDLLGHSLGGHVAMLVASDRPAAVRRLVVEDASPPPLSSDDRALATVRQRLILAAQSTLVVTRARSFDVRMARPLLNEVLRRPDPSWWSVLPTITASTLLVAGGDRSHVSASRITRLEGLIPECQLIRFPQAGHRIHSQHQEAFAAAVLPFLSP